MFTGFGNQNPEWKAQPVACLQQRNRQAQVTARLPRLPPASTRSRHEDAHGSVAQQNGAAAQLVEGVTLSEAAACPPCHSFRC